MEKVPTLAGEKYQPEIFSFDPFYAQSRLPMSEIVAQVERQVEALSIIAEEEEGRDIPLWKIALLVVVSASVGLAVRRYYVKRRGDTPGGEPGKQAPEGEPEKQAPEGEPGKPTPEPTEQAQAQEAKKQTDGQTDKATAAPGGVESKVDPKHTDSGS